MAASAVACRVLPHDGVATIEKNERQEAFKTLVKPIMEKIEPLVENFRCK